MELSDSRLEDTPWLLKLSQMSGEQESSLQRHL